MSGHSHYATTKRQKELKDNERGKVFSKLGRAITIAAKGAGGPDPDSNFKLRIAIEKARAASMPKENIDRAVSKAKNGEVLDEILYEGFGPTGISVLVKVATDNKNRTNAEIRNLFEKNGGKMGTPGSVSFNFEPNGLILVKKADDLDGQILNLIDLGAKDVQEIDDTLEVYVESSDLNKMQTKLNENSFVVTSSELIEKPKTFQLVPADKVEKVTEFLQNFEDQEDVQEVFTNAEFA